MPPSIPLPPPLPSSRSRLTNTKSDEPRKCDVCCPVLASSSVVSLKSVEIIGEKGSVKARSEELGGGDKSMRLKSAQLGSNVAFEQERVNNLRDWLRETLNSHKCWSLVVM